MARAGASRQQVELLDADADPDERVAPPRHGIRRRWVVSTLAIVAALLAVQVVVDARERAATARLAVLPGVIVPVRESIGVRWSPGPGADGVFSSGIQAGGAVIGLVHGSDGSQDLVAFDERSGARRWSTPLLEADPDGVLTARGVPIGSCQQADRDAICLVSDGYVEHGVDPPEAVPGHRSTLVVVRVDDGRVVASRPAPGVTSFAALPGLVVTGSPMPGGGLSIVATEPLTGTVRWTRAAESVGCRAHGVVFAASGGVGVWMPPGEATLLAPDGTVVRAGVDAVGRYTVEPATGVVIASSTDVTGRRSSTDLRPGPAVTYPGTRLELGVDDGSVPDLVLTTRSATVAAYDRVSGRRLWSLARGAFGEALVLRGRVYVLTSDGVVAADGSTGTEVWRAPASDGAILRGLVTDGRHVLAAERRDGRTDLAAYDPGDGHLDWRTTLPDGIDTVSAAGHLLIGFGRGTPSVLG